MLRFTAGVVLGAVLAAGVLVGPVSAQDGPAGQDVTLTTDDKTSLAASFWPSADGNAPGVVLLHMYKSDRQSWKPLVRHLSERGFDVIAVDLRGHGGSAKQAKTDLAPRVEKRDPKLFQEMHRDAIAAVRHLVKEAKSDPARIVVVGASVGCSVAIDAARRYPKEIAAVACLSPGANYLGLNTIEHAKAWPKDKPLLLLEHASEAANGAAQVRDAIAGSRLVTYEDAAPESAKDDAMWAHGTKMFGRIPLVEQTVASFAAAKSGSAKDDVVLDGEVSDAAADPWDRAADVSSDGSGIRAFRSGKRIEFGARVPDGSTHLVVFLETGSIRQKAADGTEIAQGVFSGFCLDLATGGVLWTVPTKESVANTILEPAETPAVRVVRRDGAVSVEGEWRPIRFRQTRGVADSSSTKMVAWFTTSPFEAPSESNRVTVPDRIDLKPR